MSYRTIIVDYWITLLCICLHDHGTIIIIRRVKFIVALISPYYRGGSSPTATLNLPHQAFLSEGWISAGPSARQSMPVISVQVFFGRSQPRPPLRLSFWTFFDQPSLCSTWPCHLSQRMQSTFARSPSCIISRRSCELTWPLVVTQWIIARTVIALHAIQIRWGWDPCFACMVHGASDA